MKKAVLFSFVLALILTSSVSATETRVLTMGENNIALLDEANIFLFPSRIYEWSNLAVGEFGNNDFAELGVHWKFGSEKKPWYLATYLHNNTVQEPDFATSPFKLDPFNLGFDYGYAPEYIPFDSVLLPNKRIDLFYGRKLGKNQFGMHFGQVHSSRRKSVLTQGLPNDGKDDESYGKYSLLFGLTLNKGKLDLALGFDFLSFKDKGTEAAGSAYHETKSEGNRRIHFTGRSFYKFSSVQTFIPHMTLSYAKYQAEYYGPDISNPSLIQLQENDKYNVTYLELGAAMQYTPTSNVLAVCDLGLAYNKVKGEFVSLSGEIGEAAVKVVTFPYLKIGMDADVFKWMDVRLGAVTFWQNELTENEGANGEYIRRYPENRTYLGFGFHWGRLHVDTQTDPDLFLRGLDFINGKDNDRDMNLRLSLVYEMM